MGQLGLGQPERRLLVMLRGICLALASLTMSLALRVMPVGETVAIVYLAPFVVLLLSAPVLGERVGLAGWLGALVGFAGVLLILRPGGGLDPLGVTMALVNVGFGTAYHLLTRLLARTESTVAMLWHTALIGTLGFGIGAAFTPPVQTVTGLDVVLMLVLGGLATVGHVLFTAAYREAPASTLAPALDLPCICYSSKADTQSVTTIRTLHQTRSFYSNPTILSVRPKPSNTFISQPSNGSYGWIY